LELIAPLKSLRQTTLSGHTHVEVLPVAICTVAQE